MGTLKKMRSTWPKNGRLRILAMRTQIQPVSAGRQRGIAGSQPVYPDGGLSQRPSPELHGRARPLRRGAFQPVRRRSPTNRTKIETGRFQTHMVVEILNDGPSPSCWTAETSSRPRTGKKPLLSDIMLNRRAKIDWFCKNICFL